MTTTGRRIALSLLVLAALWAAFLAGRWTGALGRSLKAEADYPWELQRKIGSVDLGCEQLLEPGEAGRFHVRALDGGETLVIATYDRETGMVSGYALNAAGAIASDSWPLDCK